MSVCKVKNNQKKISTSESSPIHSAHEPQPKAPHEKAPPASNPSVSSSCPDDLGIEQPSLQ